MRKSKKSGLPPGSVIFTGDRKVDKILIHYLQYNEGELEDQLLDNLSLRAFHQPMDDYIQWYDIRGLHDTELITEIGHVFNVHPLALEDVVDTFQRPKMDEYTDGIFITLRVMHIDTTINRITHEQVGFYLGKGFVLTFQEKAVDLFENIRQRLQKGGRIRKRNADYLVYALIDSIVDRYFLVLEFIESELDQLEEDIASNSSSQPRSKIYALKQDMLSIRKSVVPLRELIGKLVSSENEMIEESTEFFLRDLKDHVFQITDLIETYRDNLNGLQDLHISELSFRMNKVMQVLTIVATIFIPLTFLAGIYGMNFDNMPELHWPYAYFVLLGIMFVLGGIMFWFFRKNKWL